ncbi:MAG: MmcB family DNA repair protein [Pseudomonadota bacterium]
MASLADPDSALTAQDVARGIGRLFWHRRLTVLSEVMLPGGRRVDLMALSDDGHIAIVEIKVAVADLRGDTKWTGYLPWCDRFYWGIPAGFDAALLDQERFQPGDCGLLVADRFEAAELRQAADDRLSPARRKRVTALFARTAASRLMRLNDPVLADWTGV